MGGPMAPKGGGIAQKPFKGPRPSPVGSGGGLTRPSMPGKNNPVMTRAKGGTVKKAMGGTASGGLGASPTGPNPNRQAMRPSINSMRPGGIGVPRPAPGGGMTKPSPIGSKVIADGSGSMPVRPRPAPGGGMTKPSVPGKKPMKKDRMKMGRGFPGGPPIKPPKKKV